MKSAFKLIGVSMMCIGLASCGSTTKETVIREQAPATTPVVIQGSGMSPTSVEANCAHGYDNKTHSCY